MGLMEVSQLALGFLGAMVLKESLWAVVALFVPVAVVYGAFSRSKLVREELEAKVDELDVHKTELSLATGQLFESRRRIVDAQEEARKIPDYHGLDIAEEIRMRFPEVKVVLMSVYHQKEYIEGDERAQGASFIPKVEFSIQALIQACQKDLPQWSLSPAGR